MRPSQRPYVVQGPDKIPESVLTLCVLATGPSGARAQGFFLTVMRMLNTNWKLPDAVAVGPGSGPNSIIGSVLIFHLRFLWQELTESCLQPIEVSGTGCWMGEASRHLHGRLQEDSGDKYRQQDLRGLQRSGVRFCFRLQCGGKLYGGERRGARGLCLVVGFTSSGSGVFSFFQSVQMISSPSPLWLLTPGRAHLSTLHLSEMGHSLLGKKHCYRSKRREISHK